MWVKGVQKAGCILRPLEGLHSWKIKWSLKTVFSPLCFHSYLIITNYPKNAKSFKRRAYNVFYLSKGNMGLKDNCASLFLLVVFEANTRHTLSSF